MKRLRFLAPLAGALACGTNPSIFLSGDFSGPSGLAIAPVGDRDFLFVANQGSNELRAIILCNSPPGAPTTCATNQDGQFLPGPIRVFPASIIDVGERPLRLAGARLVDATGTLHGAVLVAGLDAVLHVVDAANLFAASENLAIAQPPTADVKLPAAAVDVVATSVQGPTVSAVIATQPPSGGSAALSVVSVSLDPSGLARAALTQQCAINFVPTRLALIPGETVGPLDARPAHVYVADGTPGGTPGGVGDGAVEFSVPDIPAIAQGSPPPVPPPLCTVFRRLPASDPADSPRRARALRSLALSPAAIDNAGDMPLTAGGFLIGVTAPDPALCADRGVRACDPSIAGPGVVCADQGFPDCGGGRVVLFSNDPATGQSALLPAPGSATGAPMQPLRPATPARDVAFLGRATCPTPPCTGVRVAFNTAPQVVHKAIIGLASAEDGSLSFIDVQNRRFFDDGRDSAVSVPVAPTFASPILSPTPAAGQAPTQLTNAPKNAIDKTDPTGTKIVPGTEFDPGGWFNAGVTRTTALRVVWHPALPGLDSVSGILSRSGTGPIRLTLPSKDLTPWISSPELQLGPGDFVRRLSFSTTATCADLAPTSSLGPDIPIVAVLPHELDLQPVPGFDPDPACFVSGNVGGTFEVHAGSTAAGGWVVLEDTNVLARLPHGGQFVLTGPRFDYPVDSDPTQGAANAFAYSFSITGPEPTVAGTAFIGSTTSGFQLFDGRVVSSVRDLSTLGIPGFAGPILVYDSVRYPNDQIVFTAITGANSIMRATPAQLGVPNVTPAPFFMFF